MSDELLKKFLSQTTLKGVGADRILIRREGCWNCVHSSTEKAKNLWWQAMRDQWLAFGVRVAAESPKGENDERAKMLRRAIPEMDIGIEQNKWICCSVGVKPADNDRNKEEPVADLVPANFLCRKWTAKQGASIARGGEKLDVLPEEAMDDLMDPKKG